MSAAATRSPLRANTRRVPRFPLSIPADVTPLRSGSRQSIPGRTVTLGERGLGLILAGEVNPGDSVDLDFNLPDFGGRLNLKAQVRYQSLLKCGVEFESLTPQQQRLIEHWTRTKSVTNPYPASPQASPAPPATAATHAALRTASPELRFKQLRRAAKLVLAVVLLSVGVYWWHWHSTWNELESRISANHSPSQSSAVYVPAAVMQGYIIHKIEPIYPEAAKEAHIKGMVALDVLIGPDGGVIDAHPVSGPDELTSSAVDAIRWWRFQPYLVKGRAVQVKTRLAVDFRGN